jgi:SAM-dependent methyltransferase
VIDVLPDTLIRVYCDVHLFHERSAMLEGMLPDLTTVSRKQLVDTHIIHEFDSELVSKNAKGCYGELVRRFYQPILAVLAGRRVLDCGSGFGIFSRQAIDAGFEVVSIDIDDVSIELAHSISRIAVERRSVYDTQLPADSIDVAVCFDSIQHFELENFIPELHRLGVKQLVIYDSNTSNPLLKAYRKAAGHEESHDRTGDELVAVFEKADFQLVATRCENFISLPVSGGFQRRPLPILGNFPAAIHGLDRAVESAFRLMRLDRLLAFRLLLVFERTNR